MTATRVEDRHVAIDSVKINGRFRKDLGDLGELKESIEQVGLLNPITVSSSNVLLAGHRRLQALRELGWRSVPIRVAADLSEVQELIAERDENTQRKELKPTELVALGQALEEMERPKVRARKAEANRRAVRNREARRRGDHVAESATSSNGRKSVDETVASTLGVGKNKYRAAKKVVALAEEGDEVAQEAVREMDATGNVEAALRKVTGAARPAPKAPALDSDRHHQRAKAAHRSFSKVIYGLEGTSAGLRETDLRWVLLLATEEELNDWNAIAEGAIKTLRDVRKRLQERETNGNGNS